MGRSRFALGIALIPAVALLLVPKLMLISYFASRWVDTAPANIAQYLLQDLLLAAVLYALALTTLPRHRLNLYLLAMLAGTLLLWLLLDMRVRQLWLKPLDWALIRYSLEHAGSLTSGLEVFLNQQAGLGQTFRFILFVLGLAWLGSWLMVWLAAYPLRQHPPRPLSGPCRAAMGAVLLGLLLGAACARDARYDLDHNIVTRPLVEPLRSNRWFSAEPEQNLLPFEQPAYPLAAINRLPRAQFAGNFKHLVYIVMESVRWNSVFGPGVDTAGRFPTFARLAREGLLSKSYVTVPHSSKGYYSIFTGLHAYPGVEIKEAMPLYQPSVIHQLKARRNMQALAFSSLYLQFENMDGFLKSIGVSQTYAVADLAPADTLARSASSFGASDEHLFLPSIPYLQAIEQAGQGFVALYFPSAAHYPYDCPGSAVPRTELDKYEACIQTTDALIGQMLEGFDKAGLLDSTLFVLVGDHGESFGEHGLFIHNSSMHEEEVAVPLIFWAKGRQWPTPGPALSQQTDIAPTVADLFGISDASLKVQGSSLLRLQGKRALFMSTFFDQLSSALLEPPHKYIYDYSADTLVKYDLDEDPQENHPQQVSGDEFTATRNRLLSYDAYQKAFFDTPPEQRE